MQLHCAPMSVRLGELMQLHFEPDREIVDLQDLASQNCFWLLL